MNGHRITADDVVDLILNDGITDPHDDRTADFRYYLGDDTFEEMWSDAVDHCEWLGMEMVPQ